MRTNINNDYIFLSVVLCLYVRAFDDTGMDSWQIRKTGGRCKENYWKYIDGSCNACTCSLQAFRGSTGFNFNSRTFAMPDLSCDFDTYSLSDNAINLEKFIRGKILLNISKLRFFRYSDRYGTLSRQS